MSCEACERVRYHMSADPEFYRGERPLCNAHQKIETLEEEVERLKALLKANGINYEV